MTLTSIGETFPDNPNTADKHYDTINNVIYEYNNNWQELYPADDGMIYIYNNKVYHYNLKELVEFNNIVSGDDTTILKNEDGKLTSVGTLTQNGELLYDWIGTEQEWQIGRATGLIKDNWVCFITND